MTTPIGPSDTYMPFITTIVFLWVRKNIQGWEKYHLFIYPFISFVIFGTSNFLIFVLGVNNNLLLYHIFTWFEFIILSNYIIRHCNLEKIKWLSPTLAIGFTIFCGVDSFWLEPFKDRAFNSNAATISNLVLLFLCMYYIFEISKTDAILYFQKLPTFWIITGVLFSCAVTFLLLLKYRDYSTNPEEYDMGDKLWVMMDISYVVKFAFICVGLLCYKKPITQKSQSP